MPVTTVGRLVVRLALPQKYKHYADDVIDKGTLLKLSTAIAKLDPVGYIDVLQKLNNIGLATVSSYGKDTTITLDDVDTGADVTNARNHLKQLISAVINRDDLTLKQKLLKIILLGYKYTEKLRTVAVDDAKRRKTGLANQIQSGSRGTPVQLMQLVVGDMMMKDAKNRDIPYLSMMPYVEGDSPMAYWASAMSGRKSTYDVQAATGKVGYLSKQGTNITHRTPISTFDCGTESTGIPVKADDPDNVGAILLRPFKNHKAGSVVTLLMLKLAGDNDEIIIRSPTTCKAHNGVCAKCAGLQLNGRLPVIGSYVALNAVKTFMLPLTQAGISCLHPDTLVKMADMTDKCIKDIVVDDTVLGVDMSCNCVPSKVLHVFHNGIQPMYKISYKIDGNLQIFTLTCTDLHKFIALNTVTNKTLQVRLKLLDNEHRLLIPANIHSAAGDFVIRNNKAEKSTDSVDSGKTLITIVLKTFVGLCLAMDILVDHPNHYFLLSGWILTSNSKHGSGIGGKKNIDPLGDDQPTGFDSVQRMLLTPKVFPGGAVLSKIDGTVTEIRKAPQGGSFITVDNVTVYSPVARTITVKPGDKVLAGDTLTNGVPNPMLIVKYKGIGEGRQYFAKKLSQILPKAGAATLRRNLLQFSRAMINKVRITNDLGFGGYFPGDLADYDDIADKWQPRDDSKKMDTTKSIGKYLLEPMLEYSIGTRITKSVADKLHKYGFNTLTVNDNPPPFLPEFVRSKQFMAQDRNWLPRLNGERLTDVLFDAARTGMTDKYDSPSFIDKIIVSPYKPDTKTV